MTSHLVSTLTKPPFFVYFCLSVIPFSTYFGQNWATFSHPLATYLPTYLMTAKKFLIHWCQMWNHPCTGQEGSNYPIFSNEQRHSKGFKVWSMSLYLGTLSTSINFRIVLNWIEPIKRLTSPLLKVFTRT